MIIFIVIICIILTATIITRTVLIIPTGLEASDYDGEDFSELDGVIAGCPTWNTGAVGFRFQGSWFRGPDLEHRSR